MQQIQGIGTSFLLHPKRNPDDDTPFKPIEKMSLDEVRPFMCPKSGGNPVNCVSCSGIKTCTAGQRASVLTATMPDTMMREEFKRACSSGNAWNYLIEKWGLTKGAAESMLHNMIRKYPGMAAEYGGGRRIMQRPKTVTITSMESNNPPVTARVDNEAAPAPMDEQEQGLKEKAAETARREGNKKGGAVIRERARAIAKEAFESGDPIEHLMLSEGISKIIARAKVYRWISMYPDIAGDYRLPDARRGRKPAEKQEAEQEEFAVGDDDEISLTEFLEEFTAEEPAETPHEPQKAPNDGDPMLAAMNTRYKELEAEKERLRAEISKAEERIKCIEDQQEALERCLSTFRK